LNSGKSTNQSKQEAEGSDYSSYDLLPLFLTLWRRRLAILIVCGVFAVGTSLIALTLPSVFTAKVTMLPQRSNSGSDLLGKLASFSGAQFDSEKSFEQLYDEIIKSDRILDRVLEKKWQSIKSAEPISMYEILDLSAPQNNETGADVLGYKAKKKLRNKIINMTRDKVSGYMVLKASFDEDPELAANVANFVVEELDVYLRNFRSHKAKEQREYIEERIDAKVGELKKAEMALTAFMQNNRSYNTSPSLMRQYRELERDVTAHSSVWVELRRQEETARIEEHKNLVSIDVLDVATPPVRRSSPKRVSMVIGGTLLGFLWALVFILIQERFRNVAGRKAKVQ